MPPYGRDAGMTQREADELAAHVRSETAWSTTVEPEGRYSVVIVQTPDGACTLRDDADWRWLRRQARGEG